MQNIVDTINTFLEWNVQNWEFIAYVVVPMLSSI